MKDDGQWWTWNLVILGNKQSREIRWVKDVFLNELGLKAELLYVASLTTRQEGSWVHPTKVSKYKRKEIKPTSPAFQFNNVVWQEMDISLTPNDERTLSQWNLTEHCPYSGSTTEVHDLCFDLTLRAAFRQIVSLKFVWWWFEIMSTLQTKQPNSGPLKSGGPLPSELWCNSMCSWFAPTIGSEYKQCILG